MDFFRSLQICDLILIEQKPVLQLVYQAIVSPKSFFFFIALPLGG